MVGCYQQSAQRARHRAYVWGIIVDPLSQRRGIAELLMNKLIQQITQNSEIEQITLIVNSDNIAAKRLYQKLGFQKYVVAPKSLKLAMSIMMKIK